MQPSRPAPAVLWYDIQLRYKDTALVLVKERLARGSTNYLSYGKNRQAEILHSYGNEVLVVRHRNSQEPGPELKVRSGAVAEVATARSSAQSRTCSLF